MHTLFFYQNSRRKYLLIGIFIFWNRVDFWNNGCHADFFLGRTFKIINPTSLISRETQLKPTLISYHFILHKFENTYSIGIFGTFKWNMNIYISQNRTKLKWMVVIKVNGVLISIFKIITGCWFVLRHPNSFKR